MAKDPKEMTDDEMRGRIIRLGFGGDRDRLRDFCEVMRQGLPMGTGMALRGSVVTDERWENGEPFDSKGKDTSDLDVTLIGSEVMKQWKEDAFYIPGLHTKPLSDHDPDFAPTLNPLRESLQRLVGRPVSFQATSNLVLYARDILFDQPYFVLIEAEENP